jgi:acetaldehyde dehydrogenase / alcohol dehydrogenase
VTPTTAPPATAAAAATESPVAPDVAARLDRYVERAQAAASAFRKLDQEAVDRIVWAMVVAGLRTAVELAELAMEGTSYLKEKRSVGVIDEDPERPLSARGRVAKRGPLMEVGSGR